MPFVLALVSQCLLPTLGTMANLSVRPDRLSLSDSFQVVLGTIFAGSGKHGDHFQDAYHGFGTSLTCIRLEHQEAPLPGFNFLQKLLRHTWHLRENNETTLR